MSGIADKTGEDGKIVRTAVISGLGQLFFAKAGDNVTTRYTVAAIGADAVELRDATTGETMRLALQMGAPFRLRFRCEILVHDSLFRSSIAEGTASALQIRRD